MTDILIVEDQPIVAKDLGGALSELGYRVVGVAATGEDAVDMAVKFRPEVVLMDVKLRGEIDGIAAAHRIRSRLDVPIVYLTAYDDAAMLDRAKLAPAFGYLLKPVSDRELRTALEIALHEHRMHRRLAESERWLGATLRSIGDAVIATDPRGMINFMNPVAERLTGWSSSEAVGRPVEEVFRVASDRTDLPIEVPLQRAVRERARVDLPESSVVIARDGTRVPAEDCATPISGDDGELLGAVLVCRDTSRQRKLQAELALSDRLASLGMLAGGIGHEINNPLSYVIANLDLAVSMLRDGEGGADPELRQMLVDARQGADRIRALIQELNTFSRRGHGPLTPVDVRAVVERALAMTAEEVDSGVRVIADLGPVPPVQAQEGRLVQVVIHLVMNAIQALSDAGTQSGEIHVSTGKGADGQAVITVSDNGPGVPKELGDRVFEPFFSARPRGGGAGLGLAICRRVAGDFGGKVSLESAVEKGTSVRVELPALVIEDRHEPEQPREAKSDGPAGAGAEKPRARVLVIDDEPPVCRSIERLLRGHEVISVLEGRKAIARIEAGERYDLILCDLMMPVTSGIAVYEAIGRVAPAQAERLVFMTGGAFSKEAQDFLQKNEPRQLEKPLDVRALRALAEDLAGTAT